MFFFFDSKNSRPNLRSANCAFGKLRTWQKIDGTPWRVGISKSLWRVLNELEKKVQFEVFSRHSDIVVVEGIFLSLQEFFFGWESINFVVGEKFWSPRYPKLFPTFQLQALVPTWNSSRKYFGKNTTESPASSRILPQKNTTKNIYLQWFSISCSPRLKMHPIKIHRRFSRNTFGGFSSVGLSSRWLLRWARENGLINCSFDKSWSYGNNKHFKSWEIPGDFFEGDVVMWGILVRLEIGA